MLAVSVNMELLTEFDTSSLSHFERGSLRRSLAALQATSAGVRGTLVSQITSQKR